MQSLDWQRVGAWLHQPWPRLIRREMAWLESRARPQQDRQTSGVEELLKGARTPQHGSAGALGRSGRRIPRPADNGGKNQRTGLKQDRITRQPGQKQGRGGSFGVLGSEQMGVGLRSASHRAGSAEQAECQPGSSWFCPPGLSRRCS